MALATTLEGARFTADGRLLVAAGGGEYEEPTRDGRFYTNTTTAVASVIAIPTTAHGLAIQNQAEDGGVSVVIDQVGVLVTVQTAATNPHVGIIGNLGQTRVANVADAGLAIKSANGLNQSTGSPVKTLLTGTTLDAVTGVAANWFPIGSSINASVNTLPGIQQVVNVDGRIIVAPGRMFALHTLAAAVTTSAQFYIWFRLVRLPLGVTLR